MEGRKLRNSVPTHPPKNRTGGGTHAPEERTEGRRAITADRVEQAGRVAEELVGTVAEDNPGKAGVERGGIGRWDYLLTANRPRSTFLNRDSLPLAAISRTRAE